MGYRHRREDSMKKSALCLFSGLLCLSAGASSQVKNAADFTGQTMRVDFYHVGDAKEEMIALDRIYEQGPWAGGPRSLLDPFGVGRNLVKVYDALSKKLIFSRGYDGLFGEYTTTEEAAKGVKKAYHETALIPYPRKPILFTVEVRDRQNRYRLVYSSEIDPAALTIVREPPPAGVKIIPVLKSGEPADKVDLAFIAEGYTAAEEEKFRNDLKRLTDLFLDFEPYKSNRKKFNICGVFKPSAQSGVDEPGHGSFNNTALSASFDSFGSERYMLVEDNKALRDIAAHAPYDALIIVANHPRYGGGGIYNSYCALTSDNQWHSYLLLHEFGHSFAGLADEYYTSQVAYNEFYPKGVEPAEANITALLDPQKLKWRDLVTPGTPVPTPWEKEGFDRMDLAYQKVRQELNARIAKTKREKAPAAEVKNLEEESERRSLDAARQADDYLRKSKFQGQVGAFEGAGYASTGLYRSMADCLMFTKGTKPLCRVCDAAVRRVIAFYGE
jgi:hypothetical protein